MSEELADAGGYDMTAQKVNYENFYRVPWTEAADLVRARKVLIKGGMAYIPGSELLSLVVGVFRAKLSHNLVLTCRALPVLEEDARLVNLVQNLDKRYTGEDYGSSKTTGRVLAQDIEQLSMRNFPLCMKSMQEVLVTSHHLKYKARLQYGLFLKGIGLTLEDAMKFFRGEFIKRGDTDADKFDKEYAYGIRYNYGKEGKKVNWQPWSCMKVIMENVGGGENHGCPFRHHEPKSLRESLTASEVAKADVDAIVQKVEEGHYQVACGLHFTAVHGKDLTTGSTNHPNQWYTESRPNFTSSGAAANSQSRTKVNTTKATVYGAIGQSQNATQSQEETSENDFLDDLDDSELLAMMDTGEGVDR